MADKAVALEVAKVAQPAQRCFDRWPQRLKQFVVVGPVEVLGSQQEEKRRRIDAAVVPAVGQLVDPRELVVTRFVQDLARLLAAIRINYLALVTGEQGEAFARDRGLEGQ